MQVRFAPIDATIKLQPYPNHTHCSSHPLYNDLYLSVHRPYILHRYLECISPQICTCVCNRTRKKAYHERSSIKARTQLIIIVRAHPPFSGMSSACSGEPSQMLTRHLNPSYIIRKPKFRTEKESDRKKKEKNRKGRNNKSKNTTKNKKKTRKSRENKNTSTKKKKEGRKRTKTQGGSPKTERTTLRTA